MIAKVNLLTFLPLFYYSNDVLKPLFYIKTFKEKYLNIFDNLEDNNHRWRKYSYL